MKTDRELLELAAKAADYHIDGPASKYMVQGYTFDSLLRINEMGGHSVWNPLTNDGDALRLAVSTGLISSSGHQTYVADTDTWHAWAMTEDELFYEAVTYSKSLGDACAATRRAIILSAAAIGETK